MIQRWILGDTSPLLFLPIFRSKHGCRREKKPKHKVCKHSGTRTNPYGRCSLCVCSGWQIEFEQCPLLWWNNCVLLYLFTSVLLYLLQFVYMDRGYSGSVFRGFRSNLLMLNGSPKGRCLCKVHCNRRKCVTKREKHSCLTASSCQFGLSVIFCSMYLTDCI